MIFDFYVYKTVSKLHQSLTVLTIQPDVFNAFVYGKDGYTSFRLHFWIHSTSVDNLLFILVIQVLHRCACIMREQNVSKNLRNFYAKSD